MLVKTAKHKRTAVSLGAAVLLFLVFVIASVQVVFAEDIVDFSAGSRAELDEYVYSQFEKHIKNRPNETIIEDGDPVTTFDFYVDVLNLPENEQFVIENGKITNSSDCFLPSKVLEKASENYLNDYEFLIMKDLAEKVSAKAYESGGEYTKFVLHFIFTVPWGQSKAQSAAVDNYCSTAVSRYTTKTMSKYEKALALHDFMVNEFDYAASEMMEDADIYYPWFIIQGEKRGVCQAYTALYYKMLLKAGFSRDELRIVRHDSMGGGEKHTWNLVRLDGAWYHVDVTWDDPVNSSLVSHDFFLKSDRTMRNNSHSWKVRYYPAAPSDYVPDTGTSSDTSSGTSTSSTVSSTVSSSVSSSETPVSSSITSSQNPVSNSANSSEFNSSTSDPKPPVSSDTEPSVSSGQGPSSGTGTGSDVTSVSPQPQSSQPLFSDTSSGSGIRLSDVLAYSLVPAAAVILTAIIIIYTVKIGKRDRQ